MTDLSEQFEQNRGRLRALAYRMLGSPAEADDAVQEAWLRLSRSDAGSIENLAAWLTTVVAHVCLDLLRSRTSRREDAWDDRRPDPAPSNPEQEAMLAESVGIAMLVVLDRLPPAERIAFVLHDTFAVPFEQIAAILGRTPAAVRQLASRARRRVRGGPVPSARVHQQRALVQAFLSALRAGDLQGLLAVLDPEVVAIADGTATGTGAAREVRGAATWAAGAVAFSRTLRFGSVELALVDGHAGLIWAPNGRLARVLRFSSARGKITRVDIIAHPGRLRELDLAVLS